MIRLPGILPATFSLLAWAHPPKPVHPRPRPFRIMLDPGHGGEDRGAHGPRGLAEKTAALEIAQAVGAKLKAAGFQVDYTRDDDTFIPLWDRARKANEDGDDLFISLHLNAARARSARGSEVYFLSLGQGDNDELAAEENAGAGAHPASGSDGVVASILDDLAQQAYLQDSERLAVDIQNALNRLAGIKERGVKQAPFVVLRGAAMPAVLVEAAFISNPREERKLREPRFVARVADAIVQGIRRYIAAGNGTVRRRAIEGPG